MSALQAKVMIMIMISHADTPVCASYSSFKDSVKCAVSEIAHLRKCTYIECTSLSPQYTYLKAQCSHFYSALSKQPSRTYRK